MSSKPVTEIIGDFLSALDAKLYVHDGSDPINHSGGAPVEKSMDVVLAWMCLSIKLVIKSMNWRIRVLIHAWTVMPIPWRYSLLPSTLQAGRLKYCRPEEKRQDLHFKGSCGVKGGEDGDEPSETKTSIDLIVSMRSCCCSTSVTRSSSQHHRSTLQSLIISGSLSLKVSRYLGW